MKTLINYGRGNIFSLDITPVKKGDNVDVPKTIERVKTMVGKEAAILIAPDTYAYF